jgi:ankyrin repeat protein
MSSTFQERYWILLAVISLTSVLQCQSHNQETSTGSELIQAIARQQVERARGIVHSGANLNVRDRFGTTALAEAIVAHLPGLAEELVIAGADPNFVEGDGTSPLMQAAWHCDLPIAKFLVERGARVDIVNREGQTALGYAAVGCTDAEVFRLFLETGAQINAKDKLGYTPLIHAANYGNEVAAIELIHAGAAVSAKGKDGETAESLACGRTVGRKKGHDSVCALLQHVPDK